VAVVVVFPWLPTIATNFCPAKIFAKYSPRHMTTVPISRAADRKGSSALNAALWTKTSQRGGASVLPQMVIPCLRKKKDASFDRKSSNPHTESPRCLKKIANGSIPAPPMPAKKTCRRGGLIELFP
jgi:hypothetical protein